MEEMEDPIVFFLSNRSELDRMEREVMEKKREEKWT